MNTYEIEKTHSGASLTPLATTCFDKGILFVDGNITEETATNFIQNGIILMSKNIPITVVINTSIHKIDKTANIIYLFCDKAI